MTRSAPPKAVSQSATMATRIQEGYYTTSSVSAESSVSSVSSYDAPVPLRRPRPLPSRFRRPFHPSLRRFIERRHRHYRTGTRQRWQRHFHRVRGRIQSLRWLMVPLGYAAIILVVVLVFVLLLFSPWTKVQEIRVIRHDPRVDIARVQQALNPLFGRRMLLLGRKDVLPLLKTSVPDLHTVQVDVAYPSRLIIRVTLDALMARIQIDEGDIAVQSGSSIHGFLTEEGAYMQYPHSHIPHADELPLVHITDWGVRPTTGDHILPPSFLVAIQKGEEMLQRDFGQEVTERLVFLRAREFHLRTAEFGIWFDTRDSIEEHLHRYRLFLQSVERGHVREYVDLRSLDRVVYR